MTNQTKDEKLMRKLSDRLDEMERRADENQVRLDLLHKDIKFQKERLRILKDKMDLNNESRLDRDRGRKMKKTLTEEISCVDHPDAPHGFDRNGSHNADHYVCECQGWYNGMIDDIILVINNQIERMVLLDMVIQVAELKEQREFMEGLRL